MKLKKAKMIMAISPLLILSSCTNENISSSSSSFSSEEITSSENIPSDGLYVSFKKSSIILGQTFVNAVNPTIYLSGEEISLNDLSSYTVKIGADAYSINEPLLEEGIYTFSAKKGALRYSEDFEVISGNPTKAKENNGYVTVSEEDALKYSVQNVPYAGALYEHKMPSVGNVKLLVIPVSFTGGPTFTDEELSAIQKGYFGEANETGWESLFSFYEKSSYGKLHISGDVSETYVSPLTQSQLQSDFASRDSLATSAVVASATESVLSKHPEWNVQDLDYDHDGYLDGVEIIYKTSRYQTGQKDGSNVWWNFTTYIADNTNKGDINNPVPYRYFWSNIKQLMNGYYSTNIDTHTLIHETGHMLGLNDYYDYQSNSYPTGGADMMELNIGDHNAYSKYLLGWVTPKVIDGSLDDFEITLSSFEENGDCIILRNTKEDPWNGTPYDEYLIMSYYTPTGLNSKDSKGYQEWQQAGYGTGGTYNYKGLQVFHIDERLYSRVGSTYNSLKGTLSDVTYQYTDDVLSSLKIGSDNKLVSDFAFQATSNTNANSIEVQGNNAYTNSNFKEISIIPASGDSTLFKNNATSKGCKNLGSKDVLMGIDEFGPTSNGFSFNKSKRCFAKTVTFNDGSELDYNFFVSTQYSDEITIRFVKDN